MFLVDCEEVDREKRMLEVLERVHISSSIPLHKPSGDLKIAIYIGSKMNGEAVNIVVSYFVLHEIFHFIEPFFHACGFYQTFCVIKNPFESIRRIVK